MLKVTNIAFYKFVEIQDPWTLQADCLTRCQELKLKGTLLVATEGLNGMLAGGDADIEDFLDFLQADSRFKNLLIKRSYSETQPFKRLFVKVKKEILALRIPGVDPACQTGRYLKPQEFRQWLEEGKDMVLVDTRNDFEVQQGTFKNALNPKTKSFGQFPAFVNENLGDFKDKKIVTFCTGGIRCEKATSFMLEQGFKDVYQLEGGILEYFAQTDGKFFEGTCFVFDERVALNHRLHPA